MRIKVIYNDDTYRCPGTVTNLCTLKEFVTDTLKIQSFKLKYVDDEALQAVLATQSNFEEALEIAKEENRKSLKITVHIDSPSKSDTSSNSHQSEQITRDPNTHASLQQQRQQQEHAIFQLLNQRKPIFEKPKILHWKCKELFTVSRKGAKAVQSDTAQYNESLIEINRDANLDRKYWNSILVDDEVCFRMDLSKTLKDIDKLKKPKYGDTFETIIQLETKLKYDTNKMSKIKVRYKNIYENVEQSKICISTVTDLLIKLHHRLQRVLKIENEDGTPVTYDKVDQKSNFFHHSTQSVIKEEKIYNFYKPILTRLNTIKQKQLQYISNIRTHKLWKTIEAKGIEKLRKNKIKTIKVTNTNRQKKNLPPKDRSKSNNNTNNTKQPTDKSKAKQLTTKSVYIFFCVTIIIQTTKRGKKKDPVQSKNIIKMFEKRQLTNIQSLPQSQQAHRESLFANINLIKYPSQHRALTYGFVREYESSNVFVGIVPWGMKILILQYLCDFECDKCGLIKSKNENVQLKVCNDKCIKFMCSECIVSRDGKAVYCDQHKKV
eukprot:40100_1